MVMRMSALLKGMAVNPMYSENASFVEMQVLVEDLVRQLLQPKSLVELAVEEVVKEGLNPKVKVHGYSREFPSLGISGNTSLQFPFPKVGNGVRAFLKDFLLGAAACDEDEGG